MIESYTTIPYTLGNIPSVDELKPGIMWIISDDNGVYAVNFLCPCGCGSECYTPVTDATKGQLKTINHWLFSYGAEGVTLFPSIRYTGGCKSHFNITNSKTIMHGN